MLLRVAYKSLLKRKGSVVMSLLAIAVAIFVLLGIEHIRQQARTSFASTVSGVDLIVGAKTGSLNLLLYSVFRIGNATDNISWEAYQKIAEDPNIEWSIPLSLGDSHRGYAVLGTSEAYFEHFKTGNKRELTFASGTAFSQTYDAVLGSEVANTMNYQLGQKITLAHGAVATRFTLHENHPFTVTGILKPTGTPVDQTIHVPLAGIEAMHSSPGSHGATTPTDITAFMLGLKSKMLTFTVQRQINTDSQRPMLAILPGVALAELWQMIATFEQVLRLISALVLVAAVLGLGAVLLASVREREEEIYLFRVLGASPLYLFVLIELEAMLIGVCGLALGVLSLALCLSTLSEPLYLRFGLQLSPNVLTQEGVVSIALVFAAACIAAAIPAVRIYTTASRSH